MIATSIETSVYEPPVTPASDRAFCWDDSRGVGADDDNGVVSVIDIAKLDYTKTQLGGDHTAVAAAGRNDDCGQLVIAGLGVADRLDRETARLERFLHPP